MKIYIFAIILLVLSCGEKSEVESLAAPSSIVEKIQSKKIILKYPLVEDDLGYYADEDVLGAKTKSPIGGLFRSFKGAFFNFAARDLRRGKMRVDSSLLLPREVYPLVKSLKLKRVFFLLDSCTLKKGCEREIGTKASIGWMKSVHASLSHREDLDPEKDGIVVPMLFGRKFGNRVREIDFLFDNAPTKKSRAKEKDFVHLGRMIKPPKRVLYQKNRYLFKAPSDEMIRILNYIKPHKDELGIIDLSSFGDVLLVETNDEGKKLLDGANFNKDFREVLMSDGQIHLPKMCNSAICSKIDVNTDTNFMNFLKDERPLNVHAYIQAGKIPGFDFKYTGFVELEIELAIDAL